MWAVLYFKENCGVHYVLLASGDSVFQRCVECTYRLRLTLDSQPQSHISYRQHSGYPTTQATCWVSNHRLYTGYPTTQASCWLCNHTGFMLVIQPHRLHAGYPTTQASCWLSNHTGYMLVIQPHRLRAGYPTT